MNDNIGISNETRIEILKNHIEPSYKSDIIELISGKKCWRTTGQVFETMSKALVAAGGIVSFASGVYDYPTLSFIAGAISVISLATLQFSSFSYKENKKQSNELNILLKKVNLDTMPVLERNVDASYRSSEVNQNPVYMNEVLTNFRNENEELRNRLEEVSKKLIDSENEVKSRDFTRVFKKIQEIFPTISEVVNRLNVDITNKLMTVFDHNGNCSICSYLKMSNLQCYLCENLLSYETLVDKIILINKKEKYSKKEIEILNKEIEENNIIKYTENERRYTQWICKKCKCTHPYNIYSCTSCLKTTIGEVLKQVINKKN